MHVEPAIFKNLCPSSNTRRRWRPQRTISSMTKERFLLPHLFIPPWTRNNRNTSKVVRRYRGFDPPRIQPWSYTPWYKQRSKATKPPSLPVFEKTISENLDRSDPTTGLRGSPQQYGQLGFRLCSTTISEIVSSKFLLKTKVTCISPILTIFLPTLQICLEKWDLNRRYGILYM